MPRAIQLLRVFVSSPNDVKAERQRLEKVVRELNSGWLGDGLQVELIRWETHVHPDFGTDPQAVITTQIADEYDVFIGILWSRFGTATPRLASGTFEEFDFAYNKWHADPTSLTVMIYFKDEPVSPSQMDPDQLKQVQDFKAQLGPSGGLYWIFRGVDDFEVDVRLHLVQVVRQWRQKLQSGTSREPSNSVAVLTTIPAPETVADNASPGDEPLPDEVEFGYLDYMELVAESSKRHEVVLGRMTSAMELIGRKTVERTVEAEALLSEPSVSAARLLAEQAAHDLNEFAVSLLSDIPQMSQAHGDLLRFMVGGATSALEFGSSGRDQVRKILSQIDGFAEVIKTTKGQIREFRSSVAQIPRMTVAHAKAKRRALEALDKLDSAFADLLERNGEVRKNLSDLLESTDWETMR
jgi:hypothetical protein